MLSTLAFQLIFLCICQGCFVNTVSLQIEHRPLKFAYMTDCFVSASLPNQSSQNLRKNYKPDVMQLSSSNEKPHVALGFSINPELGGGRGLGRC